MRSSKRARALWWAVASSALTLPACAPDPAGVQGEGVDRLYDVFLVIAGVIFVVVAGLIGWSIVRYRSRAAGSLPKQFRGNTLLEVVWFAIPQLTVVGLFVMSALVGGRVNERVPQPTVEVEVDAFQWGWRFSYPAHGVEVVGTHRDPPQIVVPTGEPLAFILRSQDVIHAFYVPRFLIKRDAIPGRENRIDITVDEEGTYTGLCAEFCGLLHDRMTFTVRAVDRAAFDSWVRLRGGADVGS